MTDPSHPIDPADAAIAKVANALVDELDITRNRDLITDIVTTAGELGRDGTDRLDLKITASAIDEMRDAFSMFAPFKDRPKATIFGSARTQADDPLYQQTHDVAAALADAGWMVVTGAGPGIMLAAMEGAGRDQSIGVSIRLPFETRANDVIHNDPKHVSMKYFFTRKLMLVKESKGFIAVPGGFGTLDETLELLTLQQTGKAEPFPIVLLDVPGSTYWHAFARFVDDEVTARGLVTPGDLDRVLITDSVDAAVAEILAFWRNYHSLRWVGKRLVLRLRHVPTDAEVDDLDERFGQHLAEGRIERTDPLPPEVAGDDDLELPRIAMVWKQFAVGELHRLIRALNELPSANAT